MLLYFYPIDDFILASKQFIFLIITLFIFTLLILIILRYRRLSKFKLSSVQFHVHKLIYNLAYHFAITVSQILYFKILYVRQAKFLQIVDHLGKSIVGFTFEIFEVDEDSLFLDHVFIQTNQPIDHIVEHMNALLFIFSITWRMCVIHSRYSFMFPTFAKLIFIIK